MVQAQDLRIGNWVRYTNDKDLSRVYHNKMVQVTVDILGDIGHSIKYRWFTPIPLTPSILEQCGFEKMLDHWWYSPDRGKCIMVLFHDTGIEVCTDSVVRPANNLHQLQNLYFALTGSELNYQPIK